jgi:integrase
MLGVVVRTNISRKKGEMVIIAFMCKGRSGGVVFMSKRLQKAIRGYAQDQDTTGRVLKSQRGGDMSPQVVINWFYKIYRELGYDGCSSHSGRRTAITNWARRISSVGGSLRDVQAMARHSSIAMTQRYIEVSEDACRRVVN